jgi:serine/threonine protein kinase/tetratricopeptide (TPR) repeat protein
MRRMRLEPGSKFDRYIIQGLLGEGGMGRVYRAFDVRLERRLALKILSAPGEATSEESRRAVAAILREARAAAALDHPNAVSIFELGEHNNVPFIAMELVAGRALRFFVGRPEVPIEQRLHWLTDVAKALDAAHHAGIVHLDVKPENVMVRYDDVVKVLDFGIARRAAAFISAIDGTADETAALSIVTERPFVGTPGYMAPEQALREELDGRADQFSWGVVAYELLTGSLPWSKVESVYDLINAVIHEDVPPLRGRNPDVPEGVEAIVMRSLSKARGDRFHTMGKLLDELVDVMPAWKKMSLPPPPPAASLDRSSGAGIDARISGAGVEARVSGRRSSGSLPGIVTNPSGVSDPKDVAKLIQAKTVHALDFDDASADTPPPTQLAGPHPALHSTPLANVTLPAAPPPSRSGKESSRAAALKIAGPSAELDDERGESNPIAVQVTLASIPAPSRLSPSPSLHVLRTIASAGTQQSKSARRSLRRHLVAGASLLAFLGAGLGIGAAVKGRGATSQPTADLLSMPAPPAPTAITDLPAPTACSEPALAEYKVGLLAYRDGIWDQAHRAFERATELDPNCPEAHLRLVMTGHHRYSTSKARHVFQRAVQLRTQLTERDRLLLSAFEPLVRSDPSNEAEYSARLRSLAGQYPGDAELANLAAAKAQDRDSKIELATRAIITDMHYSDAWQTLGGALAEKGQTDEALSAFAACLNQALNSVDCVRERITLLRKVGKCDAMAADARLWIARDPEGSNGYAALATALAAQGSRKTAVEEALRQRWSRLAEPERTQRQLYEQGMLNALFGEFDAVEKVAQELAHRIENDPSFDARVRPALLLVEALLEAGKLDKAGDAAAEFLKRREALWSKLSPDSVDAPVHLFEPRLIRVSRMAGRMTEEEWREAQGAWMIKVQNAGLVSESMIWSMGIAMPVETQAAAERALASMPSSLLSKSGPLQAAGWLSGAHIGRALVLAGRASDALPFLRVATSSCYALDDPFLHTRAYHWLGQALEQVADPKGACAAYQTVVSRWGAAPRSVTAEAAQKRLSTLACKRSGG